MRTETVCPARPGRPARAAASGRSWPHVPLQSRYFLLIYRTPHSLHADEARR